MINVEFDRRSFMQIGGISAGLSVMGLSDANADSLPNNEKSVVWLWLGGGATHIETFDPKPLAPEGVRSVNGSVMTNGDFLLGGNFLKLATRSDKISVVRSFAHRNSSHRTGTHWVMTGHNSTDNTPQSMQQEPSYGSIVSSVYGANHPENGMPRYVKVNGISFDGPAWLGGQCKPYEASGEGVKNLKSRVEANRFLDRKNLVKGFDKLKLANNSELWSDLRKQSYGLLLGNASEAFDLDKEPQPSRDKYGREYWQRARRTNASS
jgi:hypothetical protein